MGFVGFFVWFVVFFFVGFFLVAAFGLETVQFNQIKLGLLGTFCYTE